MATVNETGMIAHWLMEEIVNGTIADKTGSYPLTASSGMSQEANIGEGRFNKAVLIERGQRLTCSLPDIPQWTVIGWTKALDFDEYGHLFAVLNDQLKFMIKTGSGIWSQKGELYFYKKGYTSASIMSGLTFALNQWAHYAITYDGSELRFYINTQIGQTTTQAGLGIPAATYVLGANSSGSNTEDIVWLHDQRRLYNRALPLAEIIEHFNEESPYYLAGTVTEDGLPKPRKVRLYSAETGNLLQEVNADVNGEYSFQLFEESDKFVMAVPEAGRRPLVHGPLRAKQR